MKSERRAQPVLIVEDDPDSRRLLHHLLKNAGHEVLGVETAEEALARVLDRRPPCIVLDITLSGVINGIGLLAAIRHAKIPAQVAVVTADQGAHQNLNLT